MDNPGLRSFRGFWPILKKESIHIRRDPAALFFALFIPVVEMFLIGYAVNINVRDVSTVVYDEAHTQESREFLQRFANSHAYAFKKYVYSDEEMTREIVAGRAQVGIKIPHDFSRRLLAGDSAPVLVLVDGSNATVAGEVGNVAIGIALQASLERVLSQVHHSRARLPVEVRRKVLFNPDSRSANFFIPGLVVVLIQIITVILTAFSIVRERERGTLEQLFMTPVGTLGLLIGKIVPYGILAFLELCWILLIMRWIFLVPIAGSVTLLLALSLLFILAMLSVALLISTKARTQQEANQMAFGTMLPAIFLSGYVFPFDSMPPFFQWIGLLIPTTYLIDICRGIVLRGAGIAELWPQALVLLGFSVVLIFLSAMRFQKKTM
ncbi:MAG TPA: ABC transporter permease [Acidobacteriota bacterium]|jgi:ABC-2 type transport system permease protein